MRTRTAKKTQPEPEGDIDAAASERPLAPSSTNPPLLFVLPEVRSPVAKIVSLPNPINGKHERYLLDPEHAIYEFTAVSNPKSSPSSWLLAANPEDSNDADSRDLGTGYTIQQPDLYIATAMDPVFFVLPLLLEGAEDNARRLFLTPDDYLEKLSATGLDALAKVLQSAALSAALKLRLSAVCDTVEAGEETMYRINVEKLASDLSAKAQRMCSNGLPPSMIARYVDDVLKAPAAVASISTTVVEVLEGSTDPEVASQDIASDGSQPPSVAVTESQTSIVATSTAATSIAEPSDDSQAERNDELIVRRLLQVRTALDFILVRYVQPTSHAQIRDACGTLIDFEPLDKHLEHLADLKKEAQALRSLSDNISRKRRVDDDEVEEMRAEKRRKKEEEEAKKKSQNRALKQLAKTDTSGMKKMSSFFTKMPAKKAPL